MAFHPTVAKTRLDGRNDKTGLYQVIATLRDKTECRVFFSPTGATITRLLTTPCPICRRDYYCNCFDKFVDAITSQIDLEQLLEADNKAQAN